MSGAEMIRNQRWRLAIIRRVEEIIHNVAKLCRHYGISRTLLTDGIEGVKSTGSKDCLTDQNALTTVREQRKRKSWRKSSV